jgi:hypothetical protein
MALQRAHGAVEHNRHEVSFQKGGVVVNVCRCIYMTNSVCSIYVLDGDWFRGTQTLPPSMPSSLFVSMGMMRFIHSFLKPIVEAI